jgi:hypothetical protein
MSKRLIVGLAAVVIALVAASFAAAEGISASLFGAAKATPSAVRLTSDLTDASTANDASGIKFTLPAGATFADLKTLSTEFDPIAGSAPSGATTPLGCGGGSPRFSIRLASGKSVFVYLGSSPDFNSCQLNTWQSSGNLIGNDDTGRYDTSQVQAGTQSNTYAGALSLVGSQQVTEIDLVVDAGWAFTPRVQTVLVRDVRINGETFPITSGRAASPAQLCKTELKSLGRTGFEKKWGSNHNLRNAMGKCVSAMAHHKHHS